MASSASTSSCPVGSSGTTSTDAPVRRASCSSPITLLAYSARDVSTRSPGANDEPNEYATVSHARVAFSSSAISSTDAPTSAATDSYTALDRSATRSAAMYPPTRASSSRCSITVSSTACVGSAAPALLRCATSLHPGVSARARATSITARSTRGREVRGAPVVPVVGEVAHTRLLVLLHRPQQRVLVDTGLGVDRGDGLLAVARVLAVHHREDRVGPVVVRRPAIAVAHE